MAGIKIDSSFTTFLGVDPKAQRVVGAIADLAQSLGLPVVEGIETETARTAALALGCDFGQGYHLARPAAGDALAAVLSTPFG